MNLLPKENEDVPQMKLLSPDKPIKPIFTPYLESTKKLDLFQVDYQ